MPWHQHQDCASFIFPSAALGGGVESPHWAPDEMAAGVSLIPGRGQQHLMTWQNGGQRTTPDIAPVGCSAAVLRVPHAMRTKAGTWMGVFTLSLVSTPCARR